MTRWGWKQIIGLLVIVLVLFLIAKRTEDTAVFHRFLARQAEETAVDCGIIPTGTNPEPGFACALIAQQAGKGFLLQVQQPGIDSQIADGWVAAPHGDILLFNYDSDPSGGNHTGAIIYQRTCVNPQIEARQITCDDLEATVRMALNLRDFLR